MLGLLRDLVVGTAEAVGTVAGVAVAPVAIVLGVGEEAVRRAVRAGCRTQREIREWIEEND
jgi:hypothetical protein